MKVHDRAQGSYWITTVRLGFRRWQADDLDLARGLWSDPAVTKLIDARGTLTGDQVRARLAQEIATDREYGVQYWPLFLRTTGEHIGCCGLRPYEASERVYEIGFHIRSACWRRGYATEAALAVIDYAFGTLGAIGLFAGHHPGNEASRHLLEKLGFCYSRDEYYPPTGLQHPSYFLSANV